MKRNDKISHSQNFTKNNIERIWSFCTQLLIFGCNSIHMMGFLAEDFFFMFIFFFFLEGQGHQNQFNTKLNKMGQFYPEIGN